MRRCTALPLALLIVGCADQITPPSDGILSLGPGTRASLVSTWTTLGPHQLTPRFLPGAAADANGRVYVFGGQSNLLSTVNSAEVYDATTDTWSFIAPMPVRRTNQATALGNDGRIYNIAGLVIIPPSPGNVPTTLVDAYDPVTNTYSSAPPLPGLGRQNLTGTSGLDGRIYVAGGFAGGLLTPDAFVFDPATATWTSIAPMPVGRNSFAMATSSSGRIYAIAGRSGTVGSGVVSSRVDYYDPATNTWTQVASLPVTLAFHAAARGADGRVMVFGGSTAGLQGPPFLSNSYIYDEAADAWLVAPGPNAPRSAGRGVLGGDGRVYLVAGSFGGLNPPFPRSEAFGPVCTDSPAISLAVTPTELWPPNHKMITVATGISATDDCGTPSLAVTVSSNEPVNGTGDGNTSSDWLVTDNGDGTFSVAVRSERSGNGTGRVYTITATATDGDGNITVSTGTVTVPKSKK